MKWRIDYEKNFLTILLCGVMVLGMTGCGKQKNEFDIGNKSDIKISQNDVIMTGLMALLIYRILEKKLDYKYTTSQVLKELRNLELLELKGKGFISIKERTDITDDLNNIFNIKTTNEIISYKKIKKFFNLNL